MCIEAETNHHLHPHLIYQATAQKCCVFLKLPAATKRSNVFFSLLLLFVVIYITLPSFLLKQNRNKILQHECLKASSKKVSSPTVRSRGRPHTEWLFLPGLAILVDSTSSCVVFVWFQHTHAAKRQRARKARSAVCALAGANSGDRMGTRERAPCRVCVCLCVFLQVASTFAQ